MRRRHVHRPRTRGRPGRHDPYSGGPRPYAEIRRRRRPPGAVRGPARMVVSARGPDTTRTPPHRCPGGGILQSADTPNLQSDDRKGFNQTIHELAIRREVSLQSAGGEIFNQPRCGRWPKRFSTPDTSNPVSAKGTLCARHSRRLGICLGAGRSRACPRRRDEQSVHGSGRRDCFPK